MKTLRKKPTYNEMINYIEEDLPIKYPDRTATFLRNSPYLSQFDGDTLIDLEEQEKNIEKEKLKEAEIRKIANETQTTAQVLRATKNHISIQTGGVRNTETSSSGTQTDNLRPMTTVGDTQTNLPSSTGVQTKRPRTNAASVSTANKIGRAHV